MNTLCILVTGSPGSGKTALLNLLKRQYPSAYSDYLSTSPVDDETTSDDEDSQYTCVERRFDTHALPPPVEYVEIQAQEVAGWVKAQSRKQHIICLYTIQPKDLPLSQISPGLDIISQLMEISKQSDRTHWLAPKPRVRVLPILSKADQYTLLELREAREDYKRCAKEWRIPPIMRELSDLWTVISPDSLEVLMTNGHVAAENERKQEAMKEDRLSRLANLCASLSPDPKSPTPPASPLSTSLSSKRGEESLVRRFPWGVCYPLEPSHSDFQKVIDWTCQQVYKLSKIKPHDYSLTSRDLRKTLYLVRSADPHRASPAAKASLPSPDSNGEGHIASGIPMEADTPLGSAVEATANQEEEECEPCVHSPCILPNCTGHDHDIDHDIDILDKLASNRHHHEYRIKGSMRQGDCYNHAVPASANGSAPLPHSEEMPSPKKEEIRIRMRNGQPRPTSKLVNGHHGHGHGVVDGGEARSSDTADERPLHADAPATVHASPSSVTRPPPAIATTNLDANDIKQKEGNEDEEKRARIATISSSTADDEFPPSTTLPLSSSSSSSTERRWTSKPVPANTTELTDAGRPRMDDGDQPRGRRVSYDRQLDVKHEKDVQVGENPLVFIIDGPSAHATMQDRGQQSSLESSEWHRNRTDERYHDEQSQPSSSTLSFSPPRHLPHQMGIEMQAQSRSRASPKGSSSSPSKSGRKAKTQLACTFCRTRKLKCAPQPGRPPSSPCSECEKRGLHCEAASRVIDNPPLMPVPAPGTTDDAAPSEMLSRTAGREVHDSERAMVDGKRVTTGTTTGTVSRRESADEALGRRLTADNDHFSESHRKGIPHSHSRNVSTSSASSNPPPSTKQPVYQYEHHALQPVLQSRPMSFHHSSQEESRRRYSEYDRRRSPVDEEEMMEEMRRNRQVQDRERERIHLHAEREREEADRYHQTRRQFEIARQVMRGGASPSSSRQPQYFRDMEEERFAMPKPPPQHGRHQPQGSLSQHVQPHYARQHPGERMRNRSPSPSTNRTSGPSTSPAEHTPRTFPVQLNFPRPPVALGPPAMPQVPSQALDRRISMSSHTEYSGHMPYPNTGLQQSPTMRQQPGPPVIVKPYVKSTSRSGPKVVACNYCRARKTRCDGASPCSNCRKRSLRCEYAVSSREKGRRARAQAAAEKDAADNQASGSTLMGEKVKPSAKVMFTAQPSSPPIGSPSLPLRQPYPIQVPSQSKGEPPSPKSYSNISSVPTSGTSSNFSPRLPSIQSLVSPNTDLDIPGERPSLPPLKRSLEDDPRDQDRPIIEPPVPERSQSKRMRLDELVS